MMNQTNTWNDFDDGYIRPEHVSTEGRDMCQQSRVFCNDELLEGIFRWEINSHIPNGFWADAKALAGFRRLSKEKQAELQVIMELGSDKALALQIGDHCSLRVERGNETYTCNVVLERIDAASEGKNHYFFNKKRFKSNNINE